MSGVYAGRWLRVDLESKEVREQPITGEQVRTWLLGSGLAAHLFHEELAPGRDPLDPASPLLVFNGLLTGTFAPTAARTSWCGRSPLTSIWCESNVGGHWGAELRFAGFDGLVITGHAPSPVTLWIRDGQAEVRDASHLWGTTTFETHDRLRKEIDP
jgi:aldehyde:ferredoxin oxidoreductase